MTTKEQLIMIGDRERAINLALDSVISEMRAIRKMVSELTDDYLALYASTASIDSLAEYVLLQSEGTQND